MLLRSQFAVFACRRIVGLSIRKGVSNLVAMASRAPGRLLAGTLFVLVLLAVRVRDQQLCPRAWIKDIEVALAALGSCSNGIARRLHRDIFIVERYTSICWIVEMQQQGGDCAFAT
jgi:hypothetical protein